jgi:asparagine synthetase B (glutamine-hydrolysing)
VTIDASPRMVKKRGGSTVSCDVEPTEASARYPFLDEEVVRYACSLPIQQKVDISLGEGIGDKLILRELARTLGLHKAAKLKKRAMQFGSRSAKRETNRTRGVDIVDHT